MLQQVKTNFIAIATATKHIFPILGFYVIFSL